jgi:hypothetical protein
MLNQLHTTADLAADRRRTLRAEADAYRLARTAGAAASAAEVRPGRRRSLLQFLRLRGTQPVGRAAA